MQAISPSRCAGSIVKQFLRGMRQRWRRKVKGVDTEFDERPCHGLLYKWRWNVGGGIGGAEL
jgi:hypothetical protein